MFWLCLGGLKFWHNKNKSLVEKVNQEFPGQPGSSEPHLEGKLKKLLNEIEKENLAGKSVDR